MGRATILVGLGVLALVAAAGMLGGPMPAEGASGPSASTGAGAPVQGGEAILASSVSRETAQEMLKRYAPAVIGLEPGRLNPKHHKLIASLVAASDAIDRVFWKQVGEQSEGIYAAVKAEGGERAAGLARLMEVNYGPWDRLNGNEPFIGTGPKPAGAGFYPSDVSRTELQAYMDKHPEAVGDILSPYTVIRRLGSGFVTIKYSEKYKADLGDAAAALRDAAAQSPWDSLKEFLLARADAFALDDYYASELKWMETEDCPLIVVIGPYEFYEDMLMGSKASFEAIIAMKDDEETARLKGLAGTTHYLMSHVPVRHEVKAGLSLLKQTPIIVADEIYAAGDTRAGAQTTAFTLPNDGRVRQQKGTRQVILRNVARAKFSKSWLPLSQLVVAEDQAVQITFDSYFDSLVAVELARAIAPGPVKLPDGKEEDARTALRQRYQTIDEAKSDVLGLWAALEMTRRGTFGERRPISAAATYLAAVFRVIRFDMGGVHGLAKACAFNFLSKRGAFVYDPTVRRYRVDMDKLDAAVEELVNELIETLAAGDYDRAGRFIVEYGILSDDVRQKLDELSGVPVDIVPEYSIRKVLQ